MAEKIGVSQSASTTASFVISYATSTRHELDLQGAAVQAQPQSRQASRQKLEDAIYGHIQSLRALGRTTVNTAEIARALDLPSRDVERAIASLKSRGVKVAA